MDKVQEKIADELLEELFNELLAEFNLTNTRDVEVRREAVNIAKKMAKVIKKLGYRRPQDNLFEQFPTKKHHIVSPTTEPYEPTGMPPLLSEDDVLVARGEAYSKGKSLMGQDMAVTQAQRKSDIKWYGG